MRKSWSRLTALETGTRIAATSAMLDSATAEKTLPQNLEAERSVLGAILLDSAALSFVVPILTRDDFFPDTHRRIYDAMIELSQRSAEIDVLTLKEELDRAGSIEKVGRRRLPDVARSTPFPTSATSSITRRSSRRNRRSGGSSGRARRSCATASPGTRTPRPCSGEVTGEIFDIAEGAIKGGFEPIGQVVRHNLEIIEDARGRQGMLSGLATGFTELDRMTSGLQGTDLIIIAARPSVGKTSFALNIAQHVAIREGRSVGFFSLEMSKEQLGFRVLCSEADVDAKKVRDGFASKEAMQRLVLAQSKIHATRFFIDDSALLNVPEMRAKAQRLKREKGLDLLLVDYMQLMAGHGRFDNRTQEVSMISRGLKLLAKELRVPIVALSQLSRQPEARKGDQRKPQLADLRDSGSIEQDADVVVFLYREELYDRDTERKGIADVIIAKQRNGPTGDFPLVFLGDHMTFANYIGGPAAEPQGQPF